MYYFSNLQRIPQNWDDDFFQGLPTVTLRVDFSPLQVSGAEAVISAFGKAQLWQRAVDLLTDLKLGKKVKTSEFSCRFVSLRSLPNNAMRCWNTWNAMDAFWKRGGKNDGWFKEIKSSETFLSKEPQKFPQGFSLWNGWSKLIQLGSGIPCTRSRFQRTNESPFLLSGKGFISHKPGNPIQEYQPV